MCGKYYNLLSADRSCAWPAAVLGEARWLWRFPDGVIIGNSAWNPLKMLCVIINYILFSLTLGNFGSAKTLKSISFIKKPTCMYLHKQYFMIRNHGKSIYPVWKINLKHFTGGVWFLNGLTRGATPLAIYTPLCALVWLNIPWTNRKLQAVLSALCQGFIFENCRRAIN